MGIGIRHTDSTARKAGDARRTALTLLVVIAMLIAGTFIVYVTGGTAFVYPYLLLIPVMVSAAYFGIVGAVVTAIAATLLIGPYMPLSVADGTYQSTQNWLMRMVMFVGLGAVTAALFERIKHENRARIEAARTDPRTGLSNQVALEEDLDRELKRVQARRRQPTLLIMRLLDLPDALEAIGPDSADEIVGSLAGLIRSRIQQEKQVYRFSASELAILLRGADEETLSTVMMQIHDIAESALRVRDVPLRLEVAIGATQAQQIPRDQRTPHEMFRRTRIALFEAIDKQRDHCFYRTEFERDAAPALRLVSQLRPALASGELELHFQPKITLGQNGAPDRIIGSEALIRWNHPDKGMIPPGAFLPKVERTRLINPLTRFVLAETIRFSRTHPGQHTSLNLSPRSLYDARLIADLLEGLSTCDVQAHAIEVEVTESGLMRDPYAAAEVMNRIRETGARVSIDDFGTGHSSFAWLRELPVDGLKIDRAFVQRIDQDDQLKSLMQCMIKVGHTLGLVITAEGAETQGELEALRELACDQVQGFHIARPMPTADFDQWARNGQYAN